MDNGSEFMEKIDEWAYENNVTLDYSRPGKPTNNPFIESFDGSFRDECLNTHWFLSLEDAYKKINSWVNGYNNFRPHSSFNDQTPAEMVEQCKNKEETNNRTSALPGTSLDEAIYFAAAEHSSTASENTYLHEEILTIQRSPISPT